MHQILQLMSINFGNIFFSNLHSIIFFAYRLTVEEDKLEIHEVILLCNKIFDKLEREREIICEFET